ncbi:MAG: hypothetical protein CME06_08720 [Gemmatimonadetes bacterium]|nr:hypothetical protein [Gemmatimonadota bacterium]
MSRSFTLVSVTLLATSICFHTFFSGWGIPSPIDHDAEVGYGVVFNPADNLSYASWSQQAKFGASVFSDLYTTTPHRPLLFNPFFLMVGQVAKLSSTDPIVIMNIVALLCIPVFVISIGQICSFLQLSKPTSFAVLCFALGGGGVSWLRYALGKMEWLGFLGARSLGPDLSYYDLYPAISFTIYPYHAMAIALLAALISHIVRYDRPGHAFPLKEKAGLATIALALASSRPYEPILLFASYCGVFLLSFLFDLPKELRSRRGEVLTCLALGLLPALGYSFWVSTQPIWEGFASQSIDLQGGRSWCAGFLLLWSFAAYGMLEPETRSLTQPTSFLVVWSLLSALLLLVLSSGMTKLCGGCTIPLAIVGGAGLERLHLSIRGKRSAAVAVAGVGLLSLGSPALAHRSFLTTPRRVSADLLRAQAEIRKHSDSNTPVVLTDSTTGSLLPGLAGFRVFCGHWALTDHYPQRRLVLKELGLNPALPKQHSWAHSESAGSQTGLLRNQVSHGVFGYLLVRHDQELSTLFEREGSEALVYEGTTYRVLRMNSSIRALLEERFETMEADAI